MKKIVVHINTGTTGGPGGIVNNVYDILEQRGYENYIITPRGESNKRIKFLGKYDFYISRSLTKFLEKVSGLKKIGFYPNVYTTNKAKKINKAIGKNIDYIILYWYKNFIDYKTLIELKKTNNCDIFVYPMDYALLTGGCHYPNKCERYKVGCGNCPGLLWGKIKKDFTYRNFRKQIIGFKETNTSILCGSRIVFDKINEVPELRELGKEIIIPPLPNEYLEVPANIIDYKSEFKISKDDFVVFFGAERLDIERKGFRYLIEALKDAKENLLVEERAKITLLIAGEGHIKEIKKLGFNIREVGYLDRKTLIKAYKASDIFISPSILDGGPMMVKEAIMSGTPVICFKNVGNASEFVHTGETGYRVEYKNSKEMGEKLIEMFRMSKEELNIFKLNCKKIAKEKMSFKAFADKIENIFKKKEVEI